jgi:hypothetical protein
MNEKGKLIVASFIRRGMMKIRLKKNIKYSEDTNLIFTVRRYEKKVKQIDIDENHIIEKLSPASEEHDLKQYIHGLLMRLSMIAEDDNRVFDSDTISVPPTNDYS